MNEVVLSQNCKYIYFYASGALRKRTFLLAVLKTIYSRRYLRILGRSPPVKVSYIQQGCKRQKIKEAHYGPP